jgi:hypothetical protein
MRERIKGKTLVARDEGDDANGVLIKLYGEETNGAVSIIEQPFEPGLLLPPHVHEKVASRCWWKSGRTRARARMLCGGSDGRAGHLLVRLPVRR